MRTDTEPARAVRVIRGLAGARRVLRRARAAVRGLPIFLLALLAIRLVAGWPADAAPSNSCADAGHRLETFALDAPGLERAKQILVYLPPGYACPPLRRYPVFYFNDGHDLFEWNPSAASLEPAVAAEIAAREAWYGSWGLEGQLDRAIAEGRLPPLIVVGIASDDGMRSRDLAPVAWSGSQEVRGARYGDFVANALVPTVDRRFRTVAHRRCRGVFGRHQRPADRARTPRPLRPGAGSIARPR